MARRTYVLRDGVLVEKHLTAPLHSAHGSGPSVILDGMDALSHPCTGKLMDSKSEFRRVTKAHGCIEVGDQAHTMGRRDVFAEQRAERTLERDIVRAIRNPDRRPAMDYDHLRMSDGWRND